MLVVESTRVQCRPGLTTITIQSLFTACLFLCSTLAAFGLSLEESRQFREEDYLLEEGIVVEYRGEERELFFIDKGQPYHYSRVEQEQDGDLFRWVGFSEMKKEKYIRYLASPKKRIPEIVVREGGSPVFAARTVPDTICELVTDSETGKARNVYLVDFETRNFEPVLAQAAEELETELGQPVSLSQAVLYFYRRCAGSRDYPLEEIHPTLAHPVIGSVRQQETDVSPEKEEIIIPVAPSSTVIAEEPVLNSPVAVTMDITIPACKKTNDDNYKLANDGEKEKILTGFMSQLETVHAWDWGAESEAKLVSLVNIAYPIFVNYASLNAEQKNRYREIIVSTYEISSALYRRLDCQPKNQMNVVFRAILGREK